jgi:neutral ceramidase
MIRWSQCIPRRTFLAGGSLLPVGSAWLHGKQAKGLQAGAAAVDISLPVGAMNGGVIMRGGPVKQIHDPLRVRCIVLDDGVTQLAIAVCDVRMIGRSIVEEARRRAALVLKWQPTNILISATHSHAAPGLIGILPGELDRWYADFVALRIADAIRLATANLAPAAIGFGSIEKPEHVFNRRWKVKPGTAPMNPYGATDEAVVMNPGKSPNLIEPAGPVDPRMSLLSIQHTDGRPLALLANYGLHYVGGYQSNQVSADYFGVFAERVAERLDTSDQHPPFVAMMSNGASGDVNNNNVINPLGKRPAWQRMREVADDMAESAVNAIQSIEHRDDCKLAVETSSLELNVRLPDTRRLEWAREMIKTIRDEASLTRPQVYAQEAIELAKYPKSVTVELQTLRVGDLAIAAIPGEVFAESGLALAKRSPFQNTFTIELANGYFGYLPTPRQHLLGGYETWPARSSFLEAEATVKMESQILRMLEGIA